MKGPVDIRPLNIATTKPVALMMRVSMDVKPIITGVNRTPPPTPAITATTAIAVLKRNDATMIPTMNRPLSTSVEGSSAKIAMATYEATARTTRSVSSGSVRKRRIATPLATSPSCA